MIKRLDVSTGRKIKQGMARMMKIKAIPSESCSPFLACKWKDRAKKLQHNCEEHCLIYCGILLFFSPSTAQLCEQSFQLYPGLGLRPVLQSVCVGYPFVCAYLSLLRTLSKLNSWRYWMIGPRQQITGLSKDTIVDREREPAGHKHTNTTHCSQIKTQPWVTGPNSSEASSALQLTVCLVLSESRWGLCREAGVKRLMEEHTFLLGVAVELGDCVHRGGELKLSAVPLLNSHSVISLSTVEGTTWQHWFNRCRQQETQHFMFGHLSVGEGKRDAAALRVPDVLLFTLWYMHDFPAAPRCAIAPPHRSIHSLAVAAFKDSVALSALLLPGQPW